MSLEKLRIQNLKKPICGKNWEEVNKTILALEVLQEIQNVSLKNLSLEDIDKDPATCIIALADDDPPKITYYDLIPEKSDLGEPVQPKPNVEFLNRNPVATMRVCDWENDVMFEDAKPLIDFWNRLHRNQTCIEGLDDDEKLIAVIYTTLQGIDTLLKDLVEMLQIEINHRSAFRSAYINCVDALLCLCPRLYIFCEMFKDSIENVYRISMIVNEKERGIKNAAYYAEELYIQAKKCEKEAKAWLNQSLASKDLHDVILQTTVSKTLLSLENLNRSVNVQPKNPHLRKALQKIQHSFQGMSLTVLSRDQPVPDSSAQN